MCYYCNIMTEQASKKTIQSSANKIDGDRKILLAVAFWAIGGGVVVLTIILISTALQRQLKPGIQSGVGADGFRVFIEDKSDLGVGNLASKDQVVVALGKYAKSVGDAQISKVFNQNGIQRQQLTFDFKRADGNQASLFIDQVFYGNEAAIKNDNAYVGTLEAGKINNYPLYYRRALSIGKYREYSMMLVSGATVYRFVISQPGSNITIQEPDAIEVLKKLALGAKLNSI